MMSKNRAKKRNSKAAGLIFAAIIAAGAVVYPSAALAQSAGPLVAQIEKQSAYTQTTDDYNHHLASLDCDVANHGAEAGTIGAGDYRIGPDDQLDITVLEAPELNGTPRVSQSGDISLPLIGTVKAAGLTAQELQVVVEELLRHRYIKNPHVTVQVRDVQSHPVAVFGAVKKPGVFQIRDPKTVIHNHYSGFLEMVMPLAVAMALYHWKRSRRSRRSFAGLVDFLGDAGKLKSLLLLLAAVLMVVAIVFSFSRMGMISALVSVAGLCAAFWTAGRRRSEPAATSFRASFIVVFLASAVAVVAWLGVGPIVHRFELLPQNEPLSVAGQGRITLWSEALPLLRAHPFIGTGLGGFPFAFARLQKMQLTYVFNYAHNDYLQLAIELGIPFAAVLFALIYWLVFRALQAASRARSEFTGAIALGSFAGAIALLVHSAADFNLYIPANAVVFASILGLGYAQFLDVRAERASGRYSSCSSRLPPAGESVREAALTTAVQLKGVS